MSRWLWLCIVTAVSCGAACADVVHLKNGDTREGKVVAREGGMVVLQVSSGSLKANLRIPEADVDRVEEKLTPAEAYAERAAQTKTDDPEALYALGVWAEENHLPDKATEAFEQVLKLNPNHAGAANKLDYVRIDGKWMSKSDALTLLEARYKQGEFQPIYDLLSPLKDIPNESIQGDRRDRALMLYARTCERLSKWDEALQAWRRVRQAAQDRTDQAVATARVAVLEKYPNGQFLCDSIPDPMRQFDPKGAADLEQRKGGALSDEATMDLATKVQAFATLDAAKKQMDQALDKGEEQYKAWHETVGKVTTADHVLAGVAKDVRVKVLENGLAYHEGVLKNASAQLDQKAPKGGQARFQGSVQDAEKCLADSKGLVDDYSRTIDYLAGVEGQLPQVVERLRVGLGQERERLRWLQEQIGGLEIQERCATWEYDYQRAMNSANACDPRRQEYPVERTDGYFGDGGKSWRKHASACVQYAKKAHSILEKMMRDYQREPGLFSAEIAKTQQRLVECDGFMKGVAAIGDRKGVTLEGYYPW
ncbi:MAG: tetratricopeptide repeat protein [Planctomycetota bacterium]